MDILLMKLGTALDRDWLQSVPILPPWYIFVFTGVITCVSGFRLVYVYSFLGFFIPRKILQP